MVRFGLGSSDQRIFFSIEGAAYIGKWEESDQIRIAVLKLTDAARLFYSGYPELD